MFFDQTGRNPTLLSKILYCYIIVQYDEVLNTLYDVFFISKIKDRLVHTTRTQIKSIQRKLGVDTQTPAISKIYPWLS
jgi:hypothetical protein